MLGQRGARKVWCAVAAAVFAALLLMTWSGLLDAQLPAGAASRRRALLALAAYGLLTASVTAAVLLWRRWGKGILLAALSVAATLAAFDLWARASAHPLGLPHVGNMGMFSRTLHHRYPANETLRLGSVDGQVMVLRTNEDGLRTGYDRATFLEHSPRIAILGDSYVFGMGVPQGREFPTLLEALLRREPGLSDAAVLNAGVVSYSPFLERWQFEDVVRAYRPDLVLLVIDVTDVGDDLKYENESLAAGGRPAFDLPLGEAERFRDRGPLWNLAAPLRSVLVLPFEVLGRALGRSRAGAGYRYYHFDLVLDGARETNQYFLYRHPLEVTRPYFERTLRNVVALAGAVAESGATFAAVVIPRFQHWNTLECPENWERDSYALEEPYQFEYFAFFREAQAGVDFQVLDLLPAFQSTDEFPLVLNADPHWNERGHAFVARTLAELLARAELLPEAE